MFHQAMMMMVMMNCVRSGRQFCFGRIAEKLVREQVFQESKPNA